MKFLVLTLSLITASSAFAAGEMIREPVEVKSAEFSLLLTKALKKNVKPVAERRVGADVAVYTVANGLQCRETSALVSGGRKKITANCSILPEGKWRYMGSEAYGSGDNEKFSKALFAVLDAAVKTEEGIQTKTLELNVADPRGGTERNQLVCMNPDKNAVRMGFRATCQLLNAL
jgi:hypothetical protein